MSNARYLAPTLALPLALALAACGGGGGGAEGERKTAAGEVLGGSISDDMLPLDTIKSQSPPLRETSDTAGNGTASKGDSGAAADAAETAEAPPPSEPSESPQPADSGE